LKEKSEKTVEKLWFPTPFFIKMNPCRHYNTTWKLKNKKKEQDDSANNNNNESYRIMITNSKLKKKNGIGCRKVGAGRVDKFKM
jgi:hypothetical protein